MKYKINKESLKRGEASSTTASQAGQPISGPSGSRASALPERLRQQPLLTTTHSTTSMPLTKGTSAPSSLTTAVPAPLMSLDPLSAPTSAAIFDKLHTLAPPSSSTAPTTSSRPSRCAVPSASQDVGATPLVDSTPQDASDGWTTVHRKGSRRHRRSREPSPDFPAFPSHRPSQPASGFREFFVLRTSGDTPLTECNIFRVHDGLVSRCPGPDMPVSRQRDGSLLVRALTASQSAALEELTSLAGHSVSSAPHGSLNTSKGTVYAPEFLRYAAEDLTRELAPHGVTAVHRLKDRREGVLVDSPRLLLTFGSTQPPSSVKAGYVRLGVRLFIPTPRRCFTCQRFGHPAKYCRSKVAVCVNCAEPAHGPACNAPPRCFHCRGPHTAASPSCPEYLREKEILAIRTREKISAQDARARVDATMGCWTRSFAQVASSAPSGPPPSRSQRPPNSQPRPSSPTSRPTPSSPKPRPGPSPPKSSSRAPGSQAPRSPRRKGSRSPRSPPRKQSRTTTRSHSPVEVPGEAVSQRPSSHEGVVGSHGPSEPSVPRHPAPDQQRPVSPSSTVPLRDGAQSDPLSGDLAEALYSPSRTSVDSYTPAVQPYRSNLLSLPMPPNYDCRTPPSHPYRHPLGDFFLPSPDDVDPLPLSPTDPDPPPVPPHSSPPLTVTATADRPPPTSRRD